MQLHKLFAPDETDLAYLCGAHNSILHPRNRSPVRNNVDSPTLHTQIFYIRRTADGHASGISEIRR
jgi:hypothetical protein